MRPNRRLAARLLPALLVLAFMPARVLAAQHADSAAPRTLELLRPGELLRLRVRIAADRDSAILARFRSRAGDTITVVPAQLHEPLFHRRKPVYYALPQLAALDVGEHVRGGRESINRGARRGLVVGVVGLAALGALAGLGDDECGGECLFVIDDPWEGAKGGAIIGLAIGPLVGAIAGSVSTSWRWRPVLRSR